MTIKVVFFDFDGTIADTLNAFVNITNRLAVGFGYQPISSEEIAKLKNLSSRQIIKQSGIPILKFPLLVSKLKAELNHEIQTIQAFPEIEETLIELRTQVNRIGILSSNSKDNIIAFLDLNNLNHLFDFIYTEAAIFSKSRAIKKILTQEKIKPEESIYVGDETRDVEAAKRSQVKSIAVTWGFNSKEILAVQNPDFLVEHPREIVDAIASLQKLEMLSR